MNFIDYCIATRNYSAIKSIKEYSKLFSDDKTITVAKREGDEKLGTLIKNGYKRGLAGAVVAGSVALPALALSAALHNHRGGGNYDHADRYMELGHHGGRYYDYDDEDE